MKEAILAAYLKLALRTSRPPTFKSFEEVGVRKHRIHYYFGSLEELDKAARKKFPKKLSKVQPRPSSAALVYSLLESLS